MIELKFATETQVNLRNYDLFAFEWSQIVLEIFKADRLEKFLSFEKDFLNLQALSKESGNRMKEYQTIWFPECLLFAMQLQEFLPKIFQISPNLKRFWASYKWENSPRIWRIL